MQRLFQLTRCTFAAITVVQVLLCMWPINCYTEQHIVFVLREQYRKHNNYYFFIVKLHKMKPIRDVDVWSILSCR